MADPTDPIATALDAYERGWTPIPLAPRGKRPVLENWQHRHYGSRGEVEDIFTDISATEDEPVNVGLALGRTHGGLVDVDLDHPRAAIIAPGLLPETPMRTGREGNPGSHYWYRVTPGPDGYDPGIKRYSLPSGPTVVEYRGHGGQTVIPGSLHPDGDRYRWEGEPWGGDDGPAVVDGRRLHGAVLMIALMTTLADGWPARGQRHDAYLALVGGLLRDVEADGVTPKLHPMWDRSIEGVVSILANMTHDQDGAGTRVAEVVGSTRRKIMRSAKVQGWPTLAGIIGEDTVRRLREHVSALELLDGRPRGRRRPVGASEDESGAIPAGGAERPGDRNVAAAAATSGDDDERERLERAARLADLPPEQRDPLRDRLNSWEAVDLVPYLDRPLDPPMPDLLQRTDGLCLLYSGCINSIYGSAGGGKTLIALTLAAEIVGNGGTVLMVDFEDQPRNTLSRLLSLGTNPDALRNGHFIYVAPEEPIGRMQVNRWGHQEATEGGLKALETFSAAVRRADPSMVIVDGVTTLYGIHGLNTNDATATDVVGRWLRGLTDYYRRTVVLIDHTGKGSQPGSQPMGSQHKVAMVQGVALHLQTIARPARGRRGTGRLYVGKDRPGGALENATDDDPAVIAEVDFDGTGGEYGDLRIALNPPDGGAVVEVTKAASERAAKKAKGRGGSPKADRSAEREQVVRTLWQVGGGPLSRRDLIEKSGLAAKAVDLAIVSLTDDGQIKRVGSGPQTRYGLTSTDD